MAWIYAPLPLGASSPSNPLVPVLAPTCGPARTRAYAAAVYVTALAFVPLVAPAEAGTTPAAQGGPPMTRRMAVHTMAVVGPLVVPAAAPTITVDRFAPTYPLKVAVRGRAATGGVVAPVLVPDATQPVVALSWAATYPTAARLVRPVPIAGGLTAPVYVPAPASTDVATGVLGGPGMGRRLAVHHTTVVGPLVADAPSTVSAIDWAPTRPLGTPAVPRAALAAGVVEPIDTTGAAAEDVVVGRQGFPAVLRPVTVHVLALAGPMTSPAAPVVTPDLSWSPRYGAEAKRRQAPARGEGVLPPPVPVFVPSLAWTAQHPTNARAIARRPQARMVAEPVAPVSTAPVSRLDWLPVRPVDARSRRQPPARAVAVVPVLVPPVVAPASASWAPTYPVQMRPAARCGPQQWSVAPFEWPDAAIVAVVGNLWEDITPTPGASPFATVTPGSGASPFETVSPGSGASPFETVTLSSGTSPFGTPPTPRGKSPWDLP